MILSTDAAIKLVTTFIHAAGLPEDIATYRTDGIWCTEGCVSTSCITLIDREKSPPDRLISSQWKVFITPELVLLKESVMVCQMDKLICKL